jgi:hypothetical protein
LSQRIAEQRMVIGNDEVRADRGGHLFLASVAANPVAAL